MKKFTYVIIIAILALSFSAKAQIQQGNVLIGSDLSNISIQLNSPNIFNLNLTPKAAWFIQDGLALGGYVNFGVQSGTGSTAYTYGIGGLGRYYAESDVIPLKHSRFFFEGTAGFGGVDVNHGGGNTNGLDLGFGPGFSYFVTPSIGLEALLKYNGVVGFGSTAYQNNLSLNFGFQVYLPGQSTAQKVKNDMK